MRNALGSLIFLVVAPGTMAGLIPWLITGWDVGPDTSPALQVAGALFLAATATFVKGYEEPDLARRFGASYDAYRRAVPGWWPRLTAWRPEDEDRR